ncbi:hypothetical protein [Acidipila sp. EB88]|uniref:hypothetical protein n=1 Tax=Acidipila sp. EB88 TaxID=2305226 RepID=UPI000F5D95FD|nr:hypothetical protein [Acidipila sp. EB88]RRA48873.1 hypothetical protein D1Y84_11840 [Acidipila sp. EB88]
MSIRFVSTAASRFVAVTALTLAAASGAHALPLPGLFHLHTGASIKASGDTRLLVKVENPNTFSRDVAIDNHVYTIPSGEGVFVKAPAGTPIYAASNTFARHARGSVIAQLTRGRNVILLP